MSILGAILAGGASRRFGADKAAALIDGQAMMDRVIARIGCQVDEIVICGRSWGDFPTLADRPKPGMGPLGGLAAALHYAATDGFETVLTAGCDLPDLPGDLVAQLSPAPAVIKGQPLLGLWNSALAASLDDHLATTGDLSMAAWIRKAGARQVALDRSIANINTPGDLETFRQQADRQSSQ